MSYQFRIQPSGRLALVVFEGEISAEEEVQALRDFAAQPGLDPMADVLVDRSQATLTVGPQAVAPQIELARQLFPQGERRPRMAIIAPSDLDFGMARMLQLQGGADVPHEIMVVRSLADACAWLGVNAGDIVWP